MALIGYIARVRANAHLIGYFEKNFNIHKCLLFFAFPSPPFLYSLLPVLFPPSLFPRLSSLILPTPSPFLRSRCLIFHQEVLESAEEVLKFLSYDILQSLMQNKCKLALLSIIMHYLLLQAAYFSLTSGAGSEVKTAQIQL